MAADQGWGEPGLDNILTVPWKSAVNGAFDPTRAFGGLQYQDQVAWNAMKLQGNQCFVFVLSAFV